MATTRPLAHPRRLDYSIRNSAALGTASSWRTSSCNSSARAGKLTAETGAELVATQAGQVIAAPAAAAADVASYASAFASGGPAPRSCCYDGHVRRAEPPVVV